MQVEDALYMHNQEQHLLGSCKIHNKTSGGIGNSKLLWKESGPYLNYTSGDRCYNNQQRHTIIEFYCGPEGYEIEEKDLCFDTVKFSTPLACKNKKKCATLNNEVNLSQLILKKYNYAIQMNNTKYHINVCHSLVTERGLNCSNEASICKITNHNDGKETITSLGSYHDSPILVADSSAVLIYKNGSTCEEDKRKKIESSISFLCDIHSKLGFPRLSKYENCVYFLEWKTSVVCGKVDGILKNNIINNSLGDVRDLSMLNRISGPVLSVKNDQGEQTYKISLFEDKRACNGAFICDDKINYGTKVSVLYDYNINIVQFLFMDGSKCGDNLAQATLRIICKEENILSSPYVLEEKACDVEFEWLTNVICTSQKSNGIAYIYADKSSIVFSGEIVGIVVLILLVLLTFICYITNPLRRSRLIELITNPSGRHGDRVKYSRVNTEEEVHLLLNTSDPTVTESDSDDDLLGD